MLIGTLLLVGLVVGAVMLFSKKNDDCCGVSIEEQNHCNLECKTSPYKEK